MNKNILLLVLSLFMGGKSSGMGQQAGPQLVVYYDDPKKTILDGLSFLYSTLNLDDNDVRLRNIDRVKKEVNNAYSKENLEQVKPILYAIAAERVQYEDPNVPGRPIEASATPYIHQLLRIVNQEIEKFGAPPVQQAQGTPPPPPASMGKPPLPPAPAATVPVKQQSQTNLPAPKVVTPITVKVPQQVEEVYPMPPARAAVWKPVAGPKPPMRTTSLPKQLEITNPRERTEIVNRLTELGTYLQRNEDKEEAKALKNRVTANYSVATLQSVRNALNRLRGKSYLYFNKPIMADKLVDDLQKRIDNELRGR